MKQVWKDLGPRRVTEGWWDGPGSKLRAKKEKEAKKKAAEEAKRRQEEEDRRNNATASATGASGAPRESKSGR